MAKLKLEKIRDYDWRKLFFELVVVFLGVTAGFLLNNWQLEKQDKRLERKYLAAFHQDALSNSAELEKSILSDSLWLERVKPELERIKSRDISTDSANAVLRKIVSVTQTEFQTSTYEDITNSGKLHIISDYDVRKQIVDYHLALTGVKFVDDYFYRYFSDFVMPFVFEHYNFLDGQLTDPSFRFSNQFANVVTGYYSMVHQRKEAYKGVLNKSEALAKTLE